MMPMTKDCLICSTPLPPRDASKRGRPASYCSERCRQRAAWPSSAPRAVECAHCGRTVAARREGTPGAQRKYCSQACKAGATYSRAVKRGDAGPLLGPFVAGQCGCGSPIVRPRLGAPPKRCWECRAPSSQDVCGLMNLYDAAMVVNWMPVGLAARNAVVEILRDRDGTDCALCDGEMDFDVTTGPRGSAAGATIDHIHPRSRGGSNEPENLQLAHWSCNSDKGARIAVD